ncbi:MAG: Ig-like domain-containing protein, partial [Endomicrobiia bacterium]
NYVITLDELPDLEEYPYTESTTTFKYYTLNIIINPSQAGTVTRTPNKTVFLENSTVTLQAVALSGYIFSNWVVGSSVYTTNPIVITITTNTTVTANFVNITTTQTYILNLDIYPQAAGVIYYNPTGGVYIAGTTVTLTAQANSGYVFSHWSGDVGGSQNPVSILMDANKTVVAHFSVSVSTDSKPFIGSINLSTGQIVSGLYNLVISCSDDIGVSRVEVYIDGSLVATLTSSPYSYTIDTNNLSDGSHNLLVVVYDTSNQTQTTSINFTVDNSGSLDTLLKDNYLLTVNSDDKNEVIDFGDDIEWIKIYGINGKVIYESSGDVNPAFTSKPGLYIYKAKLKNGKIFTGKILVLR